LDIPAKTLLDRYESHIEVFPDTKMVLEALMEKYALIVASNAARIFVDKELSYANLTSHFSHIVFGNLRLRHGEKEAVFYEKLCTTLNISPYEIVHVGDHRIFDYETPSLLESMPITLCLTVRRHVINHRKTMEKHYIV
jgi:putative hydrolase of the HAD superfamily